MKKLYKSETNKKIAGVAAGTAHWLGIDVSVMRVLWLLFIVFTGLFPGLLLYIALAWVLPTESEANIVDVEEVQD